MSWLHTEILPKVILGTQAAREALATFYVKSNNNILVCDRSHTKIYFIFSFGLQKQHYSCFGL